MNRTTELVAEPGDRVEVLPRKRRDAARYVRVAGKVAFVELTRGKTAIIDAEDVQLISQFLWIAICDRNVWYATTARNGSMHRMLFGDIPNGLQVDHIDRDGLNNRRENLRLCTRAENARNAAQKVRSTKATSRYKGVCQMADRPGWRASIGVNGTVIYLGNHPTEDLAARAYDMAARQYFGEFARPNFPAGA